MQFHIPRHGRLQELPRGHRMCVIGGILLKDAIGGFHAFYASVGGAYANCKAGITCPIWSRYLGFPLTNHCSCIYLDIIFTWQSTMNHGRRHFGELIRTPHLLD